MSQTYVDTLRAYIVVCDVQGAIGGLDGLIENEPVTVARMPTQRVIRETYGGLHRKQSVTSDPRKRSVRPEDWHC